MAVKTVPMADTQTLSFNSRAKIRTTRSRCVPEDTSLSGHLPSCVVYRPYYADDLVLRKDEVRETGYGNRGLEGSPRKQGEEADQRRKRIAVQLLEPLALLFS